MSNGSRRLPRLGWISTLRNSEMTILFVIGCRVAILLHSKTFAEPDNDYLRQVWLNRGFADQSDRVRTMVETAPEAPELTRVTHAQAWQLFWGVTGPVSPTGTLPASPSRRGSIYGHLPFSAITLAGHHRLPLGSVPDE